MTPWRVAAAKQILRERLEAAIRQARADLPAQSRLTDMTRIELTALRRALARLCFCETGWQDVHSADSELLREARELIEGM